MVNYFDPLTMYGGKPMGHYGTASGWYSNWPQQQYSDDQQWHQPHHSTYQQPTSEWATHQHPNSFPKREPVEALLPSPPGSSGISSPGAGSPNQRTQSTRSPYEWMKKTNPNPGKTRTKDKYRVVYTDHQRLELEKEFHYSRYITIRRKAELAANLGLSERQVKIWFQNRRAKERKQVKKREEVGLKDKSDNHVALQQMHVLHHHHQQQMVMSGMMHHHHTSYHAPPEQLVGGPISLL